MTTSRKAFLFSLTLLILSLFIPSRIWAEDQIVLKNGRMLAGKVEDVNERGLTLVTQLKSSTMKMKYNWDQISDKTRYKYDPVFRKQSDERNAKIALEKKEAETALLKSNIFLLDGSSLPERVVFSVSKDMDSERILACGPHLWKNGILSVISTPDDIQSFNDSILIRNLLPLEKLPTETESIFATCFYPDGSKKLLLFKHDGNRFPEALCSVSKKCFWKLDSKTLDKLRKVFAPATMNAGSSGVKTGAFTMNLTDRHPCTDEMFRKYAVNSYNDKYQYDLPTEKCAVVIPSSYDGSKPFGLIVHISPGDGCGLPAWHKEALKRNIICVSPGNGGNKQPTLRRARLAIDSVATVKKACRIDPERVYITGFSGGGRMASEISYSMADEFTGCIPVCGVNTYSEKAYLLEDPKQFYTGSFSFPSSHMDKIRKCRYFIITGTKDFNLNNTKSIANTFHGDKIPMQLMILKKAVGIYVESRSSIWLPSDAGCGGRILL